MEISPGRCSNTAFGKERFCKPVEDLDVLMPSGRSDGETVYAYVLLLDEQYDPVGYTILTN